MMLIRLFALTSIWRRLVENKIFTPTCSEIRGLHLGRYLSSFILCCADFASCFVVQ